MLDDVTACAIAVNALPSLTAPLASERSPHTRVRRWVVLACAVWIVLAIMPYLPPLAPHRWPRSPRLVVISLVALAQALLLFTAARRRELGRRLRQAIALLAAAMFLVAVSDTLVVLFHMGVTGPALQGTNDVLELVYSVLGIVALLWMPLAPLRRDGRWLVTLDIAIAVGGMAIVLFVTTTMTGVAAAEPGSQSRIIQYGLITTGTLVALNIILVRGLARPVSLAVLFLAATAVIEIAYWVIVQLSLAHADHRRTPSRCGVCHRPGLLRARRPRVPHRAHRSGAPRRCSPAGCANSIRCRRWRSWQSG